MAVERAYAVVKRMLDCVGAGFGLVILSPVLLAAALAVRASSTGPILFRHQRVGLRGRSFDILKFRSMRIGPPGPQVTARGDPRITAVGRWLRRTKIDELPQLWNVLVGDMSLVGPRPEVRKYVNLFPEDYARILTVRPGITDFASIEYRDEEALLASSGEPEVTYVRSVLPDKIRLYHRYLDEISLGTDLAIIWRTVAAIFR